MGEAEAAPPHSWPYLLHPIQKAPRSLPELSLGTEGVTDQQWATFFFAFHSRTSRPSVTLLTTHCLTMHSVTFAPPHLGHWECQQSCRQVHRFQLMSKELQAGEADTPLSLLGPKSPALSPGPYPPLLKGVESSKKAGLQRAQYRCQVTSSCL